MQIRSLCVTQGADRPTVATFIGLHRAGVGITVTCPPEHPNYQLLIDAGVPVIGLTLKRNFDHEGVAVLRRELVEGGYHIIHTFNNKAVTNGLKACRNLPVKVICYRGIVGAVSFLDPMSWMRYLNPRIDRIICVCDAIRDYFLAMQPGFLRMPASRPVRIYKGHKPEWYTATPVDLETLGLPANAFVIGCTANYRPRKGIEYLIDALERMPADIPAHLLLVGHMDADSLSRRIDGSPARDRIHRVGFRDDAPSLSAACDVFCLPSTKREGLPRAVIEAMVYEVPPVVTDAGGSPELVVDGHSGIVVPPKDARALANAFTQLYRDPERRAEMGAAARRRIAEDFRNETTIEETLALYRELVPNPESSAPPQG
ncbi:MAG: glycosyltransferase family 4 protein [Pseudomonadota bacterium]